MDQVVNPNRTVQKGWTSISSRTAMQRTFTFSVVAAGAAGMCVLGGNLSYLAPFMATATVLANAGDVIKKTLRATLAVYLISLLTGTVGALLLPVMPATIVLCCTVGFLLCVVSSQQHPPALAFLAVVFTHNPGRFGLVWLMCTVIVVGLIAAIAHRLSIAILRNQSCVNEHGVKPRA